MAEVRDEKKDKTMKRILLIINCLMLAIGTPGGPLVLRLYFLHGGKRIWFSSFLQTAGFPITLLPLSISYIMRQRRRINPTLTDTAKPKLIAMKPLLFVAFAVIGILYGLDNILYCYGLDRLPVSTSALIIATQLAFTAVMAFFLVGQKFTAYSVNAVILLTLGAGVLALHGSGDRAAGESSKQYVMGFVMSLLAAALFGFVLPAMELVYKKSEMKITYSVMMEFQFVIGMFATLFNVVGMIVNNDFKAIPREARHYGLGEANYYVVVVVSAILWQLNFLGATGVIFCASSLLSGIMIALMMVVTEVLAVIFYKEKFGAEKGISLALSLWGFVSYFYGEFKQVKKMKKKGIQSAEQPQNHTIPNL